VPKKFDEVNAKCRLVENGLLSGEMDVTSIDQRSVLISLAMLMYK
jgi:hypothetical protein